MGYDSDFYTSRRTYSRPTVSSYTVTRREVPWEKVPFVPRPSLIADPITAFGKRKPKREEKKSILQTINREAIRPDPKVLLRPIKPYVSARDETRRKVLEEARKQSELRERGGSAAITTDRNHMDILLRQKHRTVPVRENHRRTPRLYTPSTTSYETVRTPRRDQSYSYTYQASNEVKSSNDPYSRPQRSSYSSTTEKRSQGGPGADYNYTTERTSTSGSRPGDYSYSSTTSGRLPHGTTYRHYSYRV